MKFSLEVTDANQIISYDNDRIDINPGESSYSLQKNVSLIIAPNQIIADLKISDITNLSHQELKFLQSLEPEVAIFTAGYSVQAPAPKIIAEMAKKSIGVEYMSLGAACRTYNLLALEGRRVILLISIA